MKHLRTALSLALSAVLLVAAYRLSVTPDIIAYTDHVIIMLPTVLARLVAP